MQMNRPQIENLGDGGEPDRGIVPIYAPLQMGYLSVCGALMVPQWWVGANHGVARDFCLLRVREAHQYMTRYDAFKMMHFPES